MSLKSKLQSVKPINRDRPVWKGPEVDGVTYSLLSRFLVCRERFRALVVEGLKPRPKFHAPLDYGSMWHVCEEKLAASPQYRKDIGGDFWMPLQSHCLELYKKYPAQREEIEHWYSFCRVQFPLYVAYWAKHPDVKNRVPLAQEHEFRVPYLLPSGRTVYLRGKVDSIDCIIDKKPAIWIQEDKSKSSIDQEKIGRQLTFDLQTMIYMIAVRSEIDRMGWASKGPLLGVRYNVIRRSAHKSIGSFTAKITEDMENNRASEWFSRWKVEISDTDVKRFRRECLDPILEQLCDWWAWIKASPTDPFSPDDGTENTLDRSVNSYVHWRHPFGVYNVLDEGGASELDHYLTDGTEVGLQRTDNLFPELSCNSTN